MSVCYKIIDGSVIVTSDSIESCNDYVAIGAAEYNYYVQQNGINSLDIAQAFIWGFGTVISFWFLSYVIRIAKTVINKI